MSIFIKTKHINHYIMSWNYRVLAHRYIGTISLQIHEVYYDDNGVPVGHTENGVSVNGDDLHSLELRLDRMKIALSKPILMAGDEFPKELQ